MSVAPRRLWIRWVAGVLLLAFGSSCTTSALLDATDPRRQRWVEDTHITEEALQRKGSTYRYWDEGERRGYIVEQPTWRRALNVQLRMAGLPPAVALDTAGFIAMLVLSDPDFWHSLIVFAVEESIR